MRYKGVLPAVLVATFASIGGLLVGCDVSTDQDKAFMAKLEDQLINNGDTIPVSEMYGGNWSVVCPVIEYQRVSEKVAWALNKKPEEIEIINTHDEVVYDGEWGAVFLYPPNKADYIRVNNFFYSSGADCVSRERAKFKLVTEDYQGKTLKRIQLIEE